jgi:hypothetical protein
MTETTKTRTPAEQRKVAVGDARAALRELEQIRRTAGELSRKLADLVDDAGRAAQLLSDSLGWLVMEASEIAELIADRPDDFPPVA